MDSRISSDLLRRNMGLSVQVSLPQYPEGMELDLGGLLVRNGETTEVSEEQELAYVMRNRQSFSSIAQGETVKVSGSPTISAEEVNAMFAETETPPEDEPTPEGEPEPTTEPEGE
jgi:hypothetical protein